MAKNGVQQHSFVVASRSESICSLNRYIDPLASPRVSSRTRPLLSPRVECRRVNVPMIQRSLENPVARTALSSTAHAREDASSAVAKGLLAKRRSDLIAMLVSHPTNTLRSTSAIGNSLILSFPFRILLTEMHFDCFFFFTFNFVMLGPSCPFSSPPFKSCRVITNVGICQSKQGEFVLLEEMHTSTLA